MYWLYVLLLWLYLLLLKISHRRILICFIYVWIIIFKMMLWIICRYLRTVWELTILFVNAIWNDCIWILFLNNCGSLQNNFLSRLWMNVWIRIWYWLVLIIHLRNNRICTNLKVFCNLRSFYHILSRVTILSYCTSRFICTRTFHHFS